MSCNRFALLLMLVLLALAIRGAYFQDFRHSPYYDHLIVDAESYDLQARQIAGGDWLGTEVFYQDPLYSYVLGVIYSLAGSNPPVVYLFQALLGALLGPLVAALALNIFKDNPYRHTIALLAGLLCSLCTLFAFYDFLVIKASLGLFITVAHLWGVTALTRRFAESVDARPGKLVAAAMGCGLLLGLNLLDRGNYILLAPIFALWIGWRFWVGRGRKIALLAIAAYTCGALLTVMPATVRNYAISGELVLITAQGGENFFIGNHAENTTGSYVVPASVRGNPLLQREDFLRLAERETGRTMTLNEADRYYFQRAWRWILDNPSAAASLLLKKWQLWLSGFEVPDNYSFDFMRDQFVTILSAPLASGYLIGTLGWSAFILIFLPIRRSAFPFFVDENPYLVLLAAFVLVYSASITLFFVFGRYRIPIYPVLMILGAGFAVWLAANRKRISRRVWLTAASLPILVSAAVCRPLWQPGWPPLARDAEGAQFYNLGSIFAGQGDVERALASFERALPLLDGNVEALHQIARFYWRTGLNDKAESVMRGIALRDPLDPLPWYDLAYLALVEQDPDAARRAFERLVVIAEKGAVQGPPGAPPPHLALGDIYAEEGRTDEARTMYREFLRNTPPAGIYLNGNYRHGAILLLSSPRLDDFALGLGTLIGDPRTSADSPWIKELATAAASEERRRSARSLLDERQTRGESNPAVDARLRELLSE